ncbi:MAG TPA: DUF488 family protein, partial [Kofleriaceae bacterium]
SIPYSRFQPAFSRDALAAVLVPPSIRYVYMGDLLGGRPNDPDCYRADGTVDYDRCRSKAFFQRGLERLLTAHRKGMRVCLLCAEGKPGSCHRTKLIGRALQDHGISIDHVLPDGSVRAQADVIAEALGPQGDLFGAPVTARKARPG